MQSHCRIKSLVVAIAMGVAASASALPASQPAMVATPLTQATVLSKGDMATGPLSVSQPMHVAIALNLRNQDRLDAFLADPHHALLTPAQFTARYSPTQAQAEAVADYLRKAGFSNVTIAPNRLLVSADGRADTAAAAFRTTFTRVLTHDGRDAYANTSAAMLPAAMQDTVLSVLGLQNVHVAHTFARFARTQVAHANASGGTATGHNPVDFATIYGAGSAPTAATVPVGIITEGSMTNVLKDLAAFTKANNLPAVQTQVVGAGSSDTSGDGEWDLDSQDIVGISGGVQQLVLYDAPSLGNADLQADYNAAVTANAVKVINVSLGECETSAKSDGSAAANDQTFKQAVAQGQTFSVSSGDSGADECGNGGITPSWPASSQYVVAVGGTELYTTGTTWNNETVWNNNNEGEGATGGSPSKFEPIPSWQKGIGQNGSSKYRGVPDIAMDASPDSGSLVIVDGQANQQIGGTSLASPLFVGTWARTLAAAAANGKGNLGFAAPLIYQDAAANYAGDFHDVTKGNNAGETAAVGWDYTTGFGTLVVGNFVTNVGGSSSGGGAPVANFGYTASGLTANFTDSSTDKGGTITSWAWTFGDGGTSTVENPSHIYTTAGTYSVSLQVTDNTGASNTDTQSVTVSSGGGNQLQNGVPVSGLSVSSRGNLYYTAVVPSGASNLVISLTGGTGSADMYVTSGTYRCTKGSTSAINLVCKLAKPKAGTYNIKLHGHPAFSGTTLQASWTAP